MKYQGVYWEKGTMEGCYILFPEGFNCSFCVGTDETEAPIIIKSEHYIYLCVGSAKNNCPNDYLVIEGDFDGPFRLRHSGYVIDFGTERFRLL